MNDVVNKLMASSKMSGEPRVFLFCERFYIVLCLHKVLYS